MYNMNKIELQFNCMTCDKELNPLFINIDSKGEWRIKVRKLRNKYHQCSKCVKNDKKSNKLNDSVIDYELRKAGII